ncbi:MAG: enoyl-CoA hydratase-related protein [Acidimicrobiales bacterium]|nr:enoyl-CoA hydratase-related protein [Acidimicrobiales bacterium]
MIHLEDRAPVAVVTIDRAERRNALDHEALEQLLEAQARSASARVVVLTGAGGHFCAGADLSGVEDVAFTDLLRVVLAGIRDDPRLWVAACDGAALGAGTQLAVACDVRVATASARFGIPAAKLGLTVDHWTVERLALLAGAGPARAMLLAAETYGGEEAVQFGLVQRVGNLDDALGWADEIAALAPLTIAAHKLALNRLEMPVGRGDDPEVQGASDAAWGSDDLEEGIAAFRERRRPQFRGR